MELYRYNSYEQEHNTYLDLDTYIVIKETPCGYWVLLDYYYGVGDVDYTKRNKKWVSKTSRKRLCHPTKQEAFIAFKYRKQSHIMHLTSQLKLAHNSLALTIESPIISTPTLFDIPLDYL